MSDERTVCRSCHAIECGMIPINDEWVCCDCLSKSDAMDEIMRLYAELAAAEVFIANHKCGTCCGIRVKESELCTCVADESAKVGGE